MSRSKFTVVRYEEIQRLLAAGRGIREITRALKCSRRLVRQIRDGLRDSPGQPKNAADPLWMAQIEWPQIIHDLSLGRPLKLLWEERAQGLTTYSNFWKQFYRKFPQCRQAALPAHDIGSCER
jgi:hypothetical protein